MVQSINTVLQVRPEIIEEKYLDTNQGFKVIKTSIGEQDLLEIIEKLELDIRKLGLFDITNKTLYNRVKGLFSPLLEKMKNENEKISKSRLQNLHVLQDSLTSALNSVKENPINAYFNSKLASYAVYAGDFLKKIFSSDVFDDQNDTFSNQSSNYLEMALYLQKNAQNVDKLFNVCKKIKSEMPNSN